MSMHPPTGNLRFSLLQNERGMTLVEIIVVLIILGTLIAVIGGRVFTAAGRANVKINDIQMNKLKQHISEFQLQYHKLPSSLASLVNGEPELGGGFIPIAQEDELLDPWGGPYQYEVVNNRAFRIRSLGADSLEG